MLYFFSKTIRKEGCEVFRKIAVLLLCTLVPLSVSFADVPKFYGNGAAGTVIEIDKNTLANNVDSELAEDALAYIVRTITSFSNIEIVDRRILPPADYAENAQGGGKNFLTLLITTDLNANGERVYTVDCRIKNDLKKSDVAGFVRKNIPAADVQSKQVFRVASQYLLQSLHVILTPTARKEILSADD